MVAVSHALAEYISNKKRLDGIQVTGSEKITLVFCSIERASKQGYISFKELNNCSLVKPRAGQSKRKCSSSSMAVVLPQDLHNLWSLGILLWRPVSTLSL